MALPEFVSVEDFHRSPERAAASISPDGSRIAYLAPWRNRLNVWVQPLADVLRQDPGAGARCVTADHRRSVHTYYWTDNPRWLLYTQDNDGDERWSLFRVDLDNPDAPAVNLTPYPEATVAAEFPRARPGKAVVHLNHRRIESFDLCEIDIATGELTVLAENPGEVNFWFYGGPDRILARILTSAGNIELREWDPQHGMGRCVAEFDGADYPMGVFPCEFTPDGSAILAGSNRGTDRTRLVRIDVETGVETEVDSHPVYDLDARGVISGSLPAPLFYARDTGELMGARYYGERQEIRAFDPDFEAVVKKLSAECAGELATLSSDESGRHWVGVFAADRDPGRTYYYDRRTGECRLLFRSHPHLDPEVLAPMRPVRIPARDGLTLPSYLTLPVGLEPAGLPMVLVLHGGPWFRDSWGFDATVQHLANRGYAVLQVNFRGSTGFGKSFTKAAIKEFAGAMHNDVIDAVDWAVAQGYADRDRVGIFGGSYGGYATLVGVTFTPDVFAAAIDYVGISNLANFLRTLPPFTTRQLANNWHLFVGDPDDPEQEADMLARSPITRVDDIRTPLLVAQGANDPRVVQAESDNLVDALRARGVEVEYLLKTDEGHGFVNPENTIELSYAIERFLAEHLGGRASA